MKFYPSQKATLLRVLSAVRNGRYANALVNLKEKIKARISAKRLKSLQISLPRSKLNELSSVRVVTDVDDTIKSSGGENL
jgi:hypothetical protein